MCTVHQDTESYTFVRRKRNSFWPRGLGSLHLPEPKISRVDWRGLCGLSISSMYMACPCLAMAGRAWQAGHGRLRMKCEWRINDRRLADTRGSIEALGNDSRLLDGRGVLGGAIRPRENCAFLRIPGEAARAQIRPFIISSIIARQICFSVPWRPSGSTWQHR
jgi:hypothetical protein